MFSGLMTEPLGSGPGVHRKTIEWGTVTHFNHSAQEAEAGIALRVQGQSGLYRKFQDSQAYKQTNRKEGKEKEKEKSKVST